MLPEYFYDIDDEYVLCKLSYYSGLKTNLGANEITPLSIPESMFDNAFVRDMAICSSAKGIIIDFSDVDAVKSANNVCNYFIQERIGLLNVNKKMIAMFKQVCDATDRNFYQINNEPDSICFCDPASNKPIPSLVKKIKTQFGDGTCVANSIGAMILAKYLLMIKDPCLPKSPEYVESSNVYVNQYIHIKPLFSNHKMLKFAMSQLQKIVEEHFVRGGLKDDFVFLGVSTNGAILASLLGYVTNRPSLRVTHLSPSYCVNNEVKWMNHLTNKTFILVSDVVLMGAEYRKAKTLVHAFNSDIIGCISIVKIKDIYRNKDKDRNDRFFSIINDINKHGFEYEIFIDLPVEEDKQ